MIRLLALCLCVAVQDDAYKTLSDPARRAKDADRKAAREAFRAGKDAPSWVAAKLLEKSDAEWRIAGPALADLNAILAKFWSAAPTAHKEALAACLAGAEKHAKADGAPEVFRLLALAHFSALGDAASAEASKLGLVKEGERWGRKDLLALHTLAKGFAKPGYIPAEAEKSAKSSSTFGPRYVAALLEIEKTISANSGFEALYKSLPAVAGSGAPKPAAEHLKALAEGLKAATACGQCTNGKVTCDVCSGKKKTDVTCPLCKGLGWAQKGEEANRLIKCINCKGGCVFKNATCPNCKGAGTVECSLSGGKGWRDNFKGCKDCKICGTCKGRRQVETNCATCGGKGRVPPIVAGIPTILCGGCKGAAKLKEACKDCTETGLADCGTCGGKGARDGKSPARPKSADVYSTEPCAACAGAGWPLPNLAIPCEKCFGLGFRVKPAADATKLLD